MSRDNQKDDEGLIRDFQNGDDSAFVALYKRCCGYTCKILQYKRVPHSDAEELTQDIWHKMFTALKSFRFDCPFKSYLDRAIRNAFISYIRDKKRRQERFVDRIFENQTDDEDEKTDFFEKIKGARNDEADQESLYHDLLAVVQKCLLEISNKLMRAAVVLKLEEFKIKQIAELLEIKFVNANVYVVRGMEKLRDCVERNYLALQP